MFIANFSGSAVGAVAALVTAAGLNGGAQAASFASSAVFAEIIVSVSSSGTFDAVGFDVSGPGFYDSFGSGSVVYLESGVDVVLFRSFVDAAVFAGPGLGGAISILEALQDIVITNTSAGTELIEIGYEMTVSAEADIAVMDGFFADALAVATTAFVVNDSLGIELFDDSLEAVSDALFGPFGPDTSSVSDSVTFAVSAGDFLTVFADAEIVENFAIVTPVPAPAGLPLMAAGVGALAFLRRRRA